MRRMPILLVTFALACLTASCATNRGLPPFKRLENYRFEPSSALINRVSEIPAFLLDTLNKLDGRDDYRPYTPTPEELRQLAIALDQIPEIQQAALKRRLVGIYFVRNFSSGGYSDYILDRNGTLFTTLVLNPSILKTPLSRWIAYKELSAFAADRNDIDLQVYCSGSEQAALLYILLHETAHQLDYVAGCTPYVEKDLATRGKPLSEIPFVAGTWQDYDRPLPMYEFHRRRQLGFYGAGTAAKPGRGELFNLYRDLARTPFVTLYASQNWAEDFAETAAFSGLARITGTVCNLRVQGPGDERFEIPVIDRPAVVVRLPMMYGACRTVAQQAP